MSIGKFAALAAMLALCSWNIRAEEKSGKPEKPKKEKQEESKKEEKKDEKSEKRGGNKFVNFWVHTVGGTIGNGLKAGATKIGNAFD